MLTERTVDIIACCVMAALFATSLIWFVGMLYDYFKYVRKYPGASRTALKGLIFVCGTCVVILAFFFAKNFAHLMKSSG